LTGTCLTGSLLVLRGEDDQDWLFAVVVLATLSEPDQTPVDSQAVQ